jgi:SAM-dependent methyltransferase
MKSENPTELLDTGERMIPPDQDETSIVFARHLFAYQFAKQFVSDKSVVDLGCGTGYGASLIAQDASRVVGIERDANALSYCNRHYSSRNVVFKAGDAAHLSAEGTFDVSIAFQVIEHLENPDRFLRDMKKITRNGGVILITTPNSRLAPQKRSDNPFHKSEMGFPEFQGLIGRTFLNSQIFGITFSTDSRLRAILLRSPLYRIGRKLSRKSRIKRVAAGGLRMMKFKIIDQDIGRDAIDLLAVCTNDA